MLRSKDLNISNFIAESFVLFKLLFSYWPNKVPVSHRLPDQVDSLSQPTETKALLSENNKNMWTSSLVFLK